MTYYNRDNILHNMNRGIPRDALNRAAGTPIHTIDTKIDECRYSRELDIHSVLREHYVEMTEVVERQMAEKGFIKLRSDELVCIWRVCPVCELKMNTPHLCYDGKIPVPVDLSKR